MELMQHNQKTLRDVNSYIIQGFDCCVVNPCGSGKTSVMSAFIEGHPNFTYTIITKQGNAANYYRSRAEVFCGSNVRIVTYNKMQLDYKNGNIEKYNTDFYLIDEAHYLGGELWEEAFLALVNKFKPRLIGFTATPERLKSINGEKNIVKKYFGGNIAGAYSSRDLEKQGVFVEPEYVLSVYNLRKIAEEKLDQIEDSDLNTEKKEEILERINTAIHKWEDESCPEKIFQQYLPKYMYKEGNNRILVYVAGIADLNSKKAYIDRCIRNVFPRKIIKSYIYTYRESATALENFLEEDEKVYIKILYSIDRIMETIHIDDLRIEIMLRPTMSYRVLTQQLGRINSISNKNRPLIIDMVANLQGEHDIERNDEDHIKRTFSRHKHSEGKRVHTGEVSAKRALQPAEYFKNIFDDIDRPMPRIIHYTYKGVTDTLKVLCQIFCREYSEAKELIKKYDIDMVMKILPVKKIHMQQAYIDGFVQKEKFILTKEQKAYADSYMPTFYSFLYNRDITDEDIQQELYLAYLSKINSTEHLAEEKWLRFQLVFNEVRRAYHLLMKIKYIHEEVLPVMPEEVNYWFPKNSDPKEDIASENIAFDNDLKEQLDRILSTLTDREEKVIRLRFGMVDGRERTLKETGKKFDVTKERIRQIETKALRKLRHPTRSHKVENYFFEIEKRSSTENIEEKEKIYAIYTHNGIIEEDEYGEISSVETQGNADVE